MGNEEDIIFQRKVVGIVELQTKMNRPCYFQLLDKDSLITEGLFNKMLIAITNSDSKLSLNVIIRDQSNIMTIVFCLSVLHE